MGSKKVSNRQKLSITIITYNEERNIRDALESVKWADEIVVIDSLSTDKTIEICKEYTQHVYQVAWHGYVEQKNIATERTSYDWVLNIDADERVSKELAQEIQQALAETTQYVGYYMPRRTYYLGDWINHCDWYPDYKLRLFHKHSGKWVGKALHEKVEIQGTTAYFQHDLYHYTYKDISDHVRTMNNYSSIAAMHQSGTVSGVAILLRTVFTFFKKYILKQGFRDGARGMIVCLLSAFAVTLKYAKLWERQLETRDSNSDD